MGALWVFSPRSRTAYRRHLGYVSHAPLLRNQGGGEKSNFGTNSMGHARGSIWHCWCTLRFTTKLSITVLMSHSQFRRVEPYTEPCMAYSQIHRGPSAVGRVRLNRLGPQAMHQLHRSHLFVLFCSCSSFPPPHLLALFCSSFYRFVRVIFAKGP